MQKNHLLLTTQDIGQASDSSPVAGNMANTVATATAHAAKVNATE